MQVRTIVQYLWLILLVVAASQAIAQQEDAPILRPKNQKSKLVVATLSVTCDMPCNLEIDGEAKGHIEAWGSVKIKLHLGKHIINAWTDDGMDQVQQVLEIEATEDYGAVIALKPVRDERLKAEQQVIRDEQARIVRERERREQQEARDEQARIEMERMQTEGDLQKLYSYASKLYRDKRYSEAFTPYNKACDGGMIEACISLAYMYRDGQGVISDSQWAKKYFQKSCSLGSDYGCKEAANIP